MNVVKAATIPQLISHFQLLLPTNAINGVTQIKYCGLTTLPVIKRSSKVNRLPIYKSIFPRHCSQNVNSSPTPRSSVLSSETLSANGLRKLSDWYVNI